MVLQLFHWKVQIEFLRQYLQSSSYSLDMIQKLKGPERSEEKMCVIEISIYVYIMSKLSRCPKFCSKNIQILLIHSNSRWTKGNLVATDFHVFSVIFEMPRISCSIFWDLQKYFPKSNQKMKEKKLTKFFLCWFQYQLNFI